MSHSQSALATAPEPSTEGAGPGLERLLAGVAGIEDLETLERVAHAVDAARLRLARTLDETALAAAGWANAADYLTHLAGARRGHGKAVLRLAERLEALPALSAAHTTGTVSTAQAAAITTQIATLPRNPVFRERVAEVLTGHAATGADPHDLAAGLWAAVKAADPRGEVIRAETEVDRAERGAHQARYLAMTPDRYGGVQIRGYGTAEDIATIKAALMPLSAPAPTQPCGCRQRPRQAPEGMQVSRCPDPNCSTDGRDRRDFGVRLFDALVTACTKVLTTDQAPGTHQARPRVTITMGLTDLQEQLDGQPAGRLADQTPLSAATARRLACDASLIPLVLGTDSEILDVGREHRLVTPGIWNALVARDRHCSFPSCTRPPLACDAHHIRHWADGGTTSLDNLALLCRRHHTITHHTAWTLDLDPTTRRPRWTAPPPLPYPAGYIPIRRANRDPQPTAHPAA